jgi:hypothetical protein
MPWRAGDFTSSNWTKPNTSPKRKRVNGIAKKRKCSLACASGLVFQLEKVKGRGGPRDLIRAAGTSMVEAESRAARMYEMSFLQDSLQ